MNGKNSLESLLIICIISFMLPLIISKIKPIQFPVAIAEIISGMLLGKSGLNLIRMEPTVEFLSLLGFAYLMFLSGLELDFSLIKSRRVLISSIQVSSSLASL